MTRWHWGFDDPAKAEGTEAENWAVFQRVRDEIKEQIQQFAYESDYFQTIDPANLATCRTRQKLTQCGLLRSRGHDILERTS